METKVPTYYEHSEEIGRTPFTITDPDGEPVTFTRPVIKKMTVPGEPVTVNGYVPVYSVKTTSGDTTKNMTSMNAAFRIAPRINAAGRMGSAERAIKLLLTDDSDEATLLATEISSANAESKSAKSTKPTSEARKKKSDIVDRYKEVND